MYIVDIFGEQAEDRAGHVGHDGVGAIPHHQLRRISWKKMVKNLVEEI